MIAPLPPDGIARPVLVGLSGGLDSIVLLHLLAARGTQDLRAIHVHHGLHADADAWAAHCRQACAAAGVPLRVVHAQVDREAGLGLEGAARLARHAAFAAELGEGEVLALAHHREDQAETFLLRALRASGPDALGAMRPWRTYGRGWLWRPLLALPRARLLEHAQRHGLHWVEDPGNRDLDLDRNFVRHRVLPLLRERWPQADAALARSAALSAEAGGLLAAEDAQVLADLRDGDPRLLRVSALRALHPARRARVLRHWIAGLGLPPLPAQGVARIETDLLDAQPGAAPVFAWGHARVQRWRDLLHAGPARAPLPVDWRVPWDGLAPLPLPGGGQWRLLGAHGFEGALVAHARQGGERIVLPGRRHSHALKHVLQDLAVPPWVRGRLPLLSNAAGALLAVGDLCTSATFDHWLRARDARLDWRD